jgi:hypothetical protein
MGQLRLCYWRDSDAASAAALSRNQTEPKPRRPVCLKVPQLCSVGRGKLRNLQEHTEAIQAFRS